MKKTLKYIFFTIMLIAISNSKVSALTKVWSDCDGNVSSFTDVANASISYPYGAIKYSDEVNDSIDIFKDSDTDPDYFFYFYYAPNESTSTLYYTKFNAYAYPSEELGKIYFITSNRERVTDDTYYEAFEYNFNLSGNDAYPNFTPVLHIKNGKTELHYVDGGDRTYKTITDRFQSGELFSEKYDYTKKIIGNPDWNGITHGFIDKTDIKVDSSSCNNAIDDAGEEVKKQGDTEQFTGEGYGNIKEDEAHPFLCDDTSETLQLVKQIYNFIRFLIPVLIIGFSIADFIKVVANGEDKAFKEVWNKFIKRIVIGVIILLLPYVLKFLINISDALSGYNIDDNSLFCIFK